MTSVYAYALIFLCISIEVSPSVGGGLLPGLGGGGLLPGLGGQPDNGLLPDISKCLASVFNVPGCVEEVISSFLSIQPRLIGPQCCKAVLDISDTCLPKILPFSSVIPLTLRNFCPIQVLRTEVPKASSLRFALPNEIYLYSGLRTEVPKASSLRFAPPNGIWLHSGLRADTGVALIPFFHDSSRDPGHDGIPNHQGPGDPCLFMYSSNVRRHGSPGTSWINIDFYLQREMRKKFSSTFNLLAKMISIRVVPAMATSYGWKFWKLEVKNAFLYRKPDKDIQLPGCMFTQSPRKPRLKAAKRILKYVNLTSDMSLFFQKKNDLILMGYTDADFGDDMDDRRSTSGYIFHCGGTGLGKANTDLCLETVDLEVSRFLWRSPFEGHSFRGENEGNKVPSDYGEFGDDVGPRDGSYDDVGECEESYTSHFEPRFGVRYNPFIRKAYESYNESIREECENLFSSPCSTSYQDQHGVNGYPSYIRCCPMRKKKYASLKPTGRSVHSGKVTICGIPGCLIVLNDRYYIKYILPSMVDNLGLFQEPLLVPYFLDGFKVTERVRVVFSQFDYHEEVWCNVFPLTYGHVSLGADWFAQHKVPHLQNWPNVVRDQ
ncbi:putative F-box protein-like [Capsicum annuum]|nr:putative F-box protein-like [Capsicum annuum]